MNIRLLGRIVVSLVLAASTAAAQQSFSRIDSAHFSVRYQSRIPEGEARELITFLETERNDILRQLRLEDKRKLEVRIYNSVGVFLAESGARKPWRAALLSRGVLHLQPLEALRARDMMREAIVFELAMYLLEPVAARGCPRWLREAYAVHRSHEAERLTQPVGVRLQSFADLAQDIQDYPAPPERDDVHAILARTMEFFVDRYGEAAAFGMFRAFDGNSSEEKAISSVLRQPIAEVEKGWAAAIRTASPRVRTR
jgi:hypothetical protein